MNGDEYTLRIVPCGQGARASEEQNEYPQERPIGGGGIPEEKEGYYLVEKIGQSCASVFSKQVKISDDISVNVQFGWNLEFFKKEQGQASPSPSEGEQILRQSRLLNAAMADLIERFRDKVVVFCDGRVLAVGDSEADAISRIPPGDRSLPAVVRRISVESEPDFMGGPKGV